VGAWWKVFKKKVSAAEHSPPRYGSANGAWKPRYSLTQTLKLVCWRLGCGTFVSCKMEACSLARSCEVVASSLCVRQSNEPRLR
jgi:hypothetical protein